MNYNLNELLAEMAALNVPTVSAAAKGGSYSFGIVNSKNNGKRVSISKALAAALELEDYVQMAPNPRANILLLGKKLPEVLPDVSDGRLSGEEKKICYSAELVQLLTETFNLNFEKCTSMAFSEISIESNNGEPIAVIEVKNKAPRAGEVGESA